MLPHFVASLLRRYGLSYCAYCVIDRNGHTNAVGNASPQVRASTGFTFIALLMLRHNVDQEIISTINVFLQQALIIADDIFACYHQYRLFILGLSMVLVSISAAADFISSSITVIKLQTDWFLYIGQSVGFLFILLSLVRSSDSYLRGLMRLNSVAFAFLLILLLLSPVLPPMDMMTRTIVGFSRFVICMFILIAYYSTYMGKPSVPL